MKNWLVVCPTEIEYEETKNVFKKYDKGESCCTDMEDLYVFYFPKDIIYVLRGGIGRTLSTSRVTSALTLLDIHAVVVLGTCGALNGLSVGTTVYATKCNFGDFNTFDEVNYLGCAASDEKFLSENKKPLSLKQSLDFYGIKKVKAVSVDHIVDGDERAKLGEQYSIVDMESANISTVCRMFNKEFLSIRTVTDVDNFKDYEKNAKIAAKNSAMVFAKAITKSVSNADILNALGSHCYLNFPKKGVNFVDISGILETPEYFKYVLSKMKEYIPSQTTKLVAIESRGFLFASPLAVELNIPLVMVRKKGKLPGILTKVEYKKEYGKDELYYQNIAFNKNDKVVIIDDLGFTYNTVKALRQSLVNYGVEVLTIVVAGALQYPDDLLGVEYALDLVTQEK